MGVGQVGAVIAPLAGLRPGLSRSGVFGPDSEVTAAACSCAATSLERVCSPMVCANFSATLSTFCATDEILSAARVAASPIFVSGNFISPILKSGNAMVARSGLVSAAAVVRWAATVGNA